MSTEKTEPLGKTLKHVADIIEREVSYFNGWWVPFETMRANCETAAKKISKYLYGKVVK